MSSIEQLKPQPSLYLDNAYYDALIAWRDDAPSYGRVEDVGVVASSAALLNFEARLLDSRRFYEWLDLFSQDCVYWVPAAPFADPRREVNISFDDRRRMEDRIIRFETGFAHNQEPDRRLKRLVSNIEAWESGDGNSRRVMANEQIFEARTGKPGSEFVVSLDYWLVRDAQDWKIKVKRAVLINSEDGLEAPTFL